MKKIYKYCFGVADQVELEMPEGAEFLCVQVQFGGPCLWAIVDDEAKLETRILRIIGTGHSLPSSEQLAYIGTIQEAGGGLIWHVFDKLPN